MARRSLKIDEASDSRNRIALAYDLSGLALVLRKAKRSAEAEPLMQRNVSILEEALGNNHPSVAIGLNNLAILRLETGRIAEAEPLYRRALAIAEAGLPPDHPQIAMPLNNLAWLKAKQGDWASALSFIRRATDIRVANATRMVGGSPETQRRLVSQMADGLDGHVLMAYRAAGDDPALRDEAYIVAQRRPQSEAALALSQASARFASGSGELAALLRQQQDLIRDREAVDRRLLAALSKGDRAGSESARSDEAQLDARLDPIAKRLAAQFPEYSSLVNPEPLPVAATQALLRDNEALVLFLASAGAAEPYAFPEYAFAWVITKGEARWLNLPTGARKIWEQVRKLRCGLDSSNWRAGEKSRETCKELLGTEVSENDLPPFDADLAYALYHDLFGAAEDLIKGKSLLIVPSGALTQLPFDALVTAKPDESLQRFAAYKSVKWLGQRQPIAVLPSVASFKALRAVKKGAATEPYIGFGNPLLTGLSGNDRSAWAAQFCRAPASGERKLVAQARGLARPFPELYRPGGGVADVEALRRQPPLPDTAEELCAVARLLGASADSVYLGVKATEARVEALSAQGALAKARVVHFATHGLVAGETQEIARASKAEPALLLTPPQIASEQDDGLLTASEVAALKLDADWVILSACNTASGGAQDAEALSGLARAFFYAGARALLVSHWYVDSAATVELVTGAFGEMKANPEIGRAEAMRRAMASLIAQGGRSAHPSVWAPFVLVGSAER